MNLKILFESYTKTEKPFILSGLYKGLFLKAGKLQELKDEVRNQGFDVILVIDEFEGPVKERIEL